MAKNKNKKKKVIIQTIDIRLPCSRTSDSMRFLGLSLHSAFLSSLGLEIDKVYAGPFRLSSMRFLALTSARLRSPPSTL